MVIGDKSSGKPLGGLQALFFRYGMKFALGYGYMDISDLWKPAATNCGRTPAQFHQGRKV
jgi:hypothetical protein